jgi:hypothetical protein
MICRKTTIFTLSGQNENTKDLTLTVNNHSGDLAKIIKCTTEPGIYMAVWNTRETNPGTYFVTLEAGKKEMTKQGTVKERWLWPAGNKKK